MPWKSRLALGSDWDQIGAQMGSTLAPKCIFWEPINPCLHGCFISHVWVSSVPSEYGTAGPPAWLIAIRRTVVLSVGISVILLSIGCSVERFRAAQIERETLARMQAVGGSTIGMTRVETYDILRRTGLVAASRQRWGVIWPPRQFRVTRQVVTNPELIVSSG